jgi:hypothetical protein
MFEQAFKNINDILWKEAGCTTELDYTEQTSWLLFLLSNCSTVTCRPSSTTKPNYVPCGAPPTRAASCSRD